MKRKIDPISDLKFVWESGGVPYKYVYTPDAVRKEKKTTLELGHQVEKVYKKRDRL